MSLWEDVRSVLVALDEGGNAIAGPETKDPAAGNPHYTLSQRWGFACKNDPVKYADACAMCKVLTRVENFLGLVFGQSDWRLASDHCRDAIAGFPPDLPGEG